jgi:predicted transcriptional regulator
MSQEDKADYGLVSLQRNVRDVQPTALVAEFLVILDWARDMKRACR